jgi:uncharacterized membrane protein/nitrite reductase/ring-hydroxylating ferredoxin subunit
MRSSASLRGHPIHPALIPFPIAFLVGALAFDAAGLVLGRPALWQAGWYLAIAGVVMALVAAVPGVIDYFRTVPPDSSAKQRATRHGLANVTATVLFATAWLVRGAAAAEPVVATLALQAVGVVLLTVGGWMGGTLVFRNQIGVDHRYARAGKWSELRLGADDVANGRVAVARRDELELDQLKLVVIDGRRIVLGRAEHGYVAFDDHCTHKGGSLAGGSMMCGRVLCPWHGSQFDVRTGAVHAGPAQREIRTYAVEESDDVVRIVLA